MICNEHSSLGPLLFVALATLESRPLPPNTQHLGVQASGSEGDMFWVQGPLSLVTSQGDSIKGHLPPSMFSAFPARDLLQAQANPHAFVLLEKICLIKAKLDSAAE